MGSIDNELILGAEQDAQEVAFIRNQLPQELKEKFSDDELYYFIDVMAEYYTDSGVFDEAVADDDGYVDIDLEAVAAYVVKQAKKDDMGEYEPDEILLVAQADADFMDFADEEDAD